MRTLHRKYVEKFDINLIYNENGREDLQGNMEINQDNLREGMNGTSALIEGGWYFNNYPKMREMFPDHDIHYIVLNPSLDTIHSNYLKRHPNSKKHETNDFENWDKTIYMVRYKSAKKLLDNPEVTTLELTNESLEEKITAVLNLVHNNNDKTIFVITGSNCAGKSTLYKNVKQRLEF